jgi:hypothetical protein
MKIYLKLHSITLSFVYAHLFRFQLAYPGKQRAKVTMIGFCLPTAATKVVAQWFK